MRRRMRPVFCAGLLLALPPWHSLLAVNAEAPPPPAATNELVLVREGRPACVIAFPAAYAPVAAEAAWELRYCLQKISGADVPVKRESTLSSAEKEGTLVLVGDGELSRVSGVQVGDLKPEGFRIKTTGRHLVLAGRDDSLGREEHQRGTMHAVAAFLENQLGVRWLWPGTNGEVFPQSRTVSVGALDFSDAPVLLDRTVRDGLFSARNADARRHIAMDEPAVQRLREQSQTWLRRLRFGRSLNLHYQHGFTNWWNEYHWRHPDYFALHQNRSREWPARLGDYDRVKICVSNPRVLERFIANARSFFERNPDFLSFSASPNDNAYSGHCLCDECRSWDVPGAPKVQLMSVDTTGRRVTFEAPALTDRYLRFYNRAAEQLAKFAPDKFIAGYAYGAWLTPPVREAVRSNVLISVVAYSHLTDSEIAASRQAWDGWAQRTPRLILRPNLLNFGHGYPLNYTAWLGDTLRHCAETGMMASYWDTLQHHWAAQGLNYYVLARLLWNPHANVAAIVQDYCEQGFGPAAPAIRAYYDALQQHTDKIRSLPVDRRTNFATVTLTLHTPEHLGALQRHLDQARVLALDYPRVLARIDFLDTGLAYARLQSEVVRCIESKDWPAARQAETARDRFYREQLHSFGVGVPDLLATELTKRNVFRVGERGGSSAR